MFGKNKVCESCGSDFSRTCEAEAYIGNNCFDCSFWLKKIAISAEDKARRVIVDGQHYRLGLNNTGAFKGFGGRQFTILFHDGRIIETSNLWHQGTVSEQFREMLPDNAVFIQVKATQVMPADDLDFPF